MTGAAPQPKGGFILTQMVEDKPATHKEFNTAEEAIWAARTAIADATRPLIHQKTLVIVSDDQDRIAWAAASDGWETDYQSGSSPEMD